MSVDNVNETGAGSPPPSVSTIFRPSAPRTHLTLGLTCVDTDGIAIQRSQRTERPGRLYMRRRAVQARTHADLARLTLGRLQDADGLDCSTPSPQSCFEQCQKKKTNEYLPFARS